MRKKVKYLTITVRDVAMASAGTEECPIAQCAKRTGLDEDPCAGIMNARIGLYIWGYSRRLKDEVFRFDVGRGFRPGRYQIWRFV